MSRVIPWKHDSLKAGREQLAGSRHGCGQLCPMASSPCVGPSLSSVPANRGRGTASEPGPACWDRAAVSAAPGVCGALSESLCVREGGS